MKRWAGLSEIKPERIEEYKRLHQDVWPGVLRALRAGHLRNYSIYHYQRPDGRHLLFSYFEYTGDDFAADMNRIDADPEMQRWWENCKPCFIPMADGVGEEFFPGMEELFHAD